MASTIEEVKIRLARRGIHVPQSFSEWEDIRGSIIHEDVIIYDS